MGIHDGHRQRLRERFRQEGLEGFAPHEVLELILIYARARGDVNPRAHEPRDTFGFLKGVLEATPSQLMTVPGVGEETATLLGLMVPVFRRYEQCLVDEKLWMGNINEALKYCQALLKGYRVECFHVLCLDTQGKLLGQRKIAQGTLGEVHAYPRMVAETALNYNAHSVILCHNHPSGDPEPSREDISVTIKMQKLLEGMGMVLLDHVIVGSNEAYSMLQHGLLSNRE